jgi:hypothetical protein
MDIDNISIEDLKKYRPDLFEDLKQEVYLGELRLTKDDIISLIEPLSDNIKNHLKPYLPKLRTMTYNDIVDMENDIVDEISEQLLNEFEELEQIVGLRPKRKVKYVPKAVPVTNETLEPSEEETKLDLLIASLEDLKKHRPDLCDLLYDEFLKDHPLDTPQAHKDTEEEKEEVVNDINGVKKGDAIRWNYTKEEGIVIGFEEEDGISNIIVRRYNGTKVLFENDPKLFTILEGVEKDKVISKREHYIAESKEKKDTGRAFIPKKPQKTKTIYDGVMYNEPTRRGSKLKVGDHIRFKLTKGFGVVKGFMRRGGLDRIVMGKSEGLPESIIDNPEAYEIVDAKPKQDTSPNKTTASSNSAKSKYFPRRKMEVRKANIGDTVQRKSDGLIGKVVEIRNLGYGIEKLILQLKDGSESGVFNETSLYYVLTD